MLLPGVRKCMFRLVPQVLGMLTYLPANLHIAATAEQYIVLTQPSRAKQTCTAGTGPHCLQVLLYLFWTVPPALNLHTFHTHRNSRESQCLVVQILSIWHEWRKASPNQIEWLITIMSKSGLFGFVFFPPLFLFASTDPILQFTKKLLLFSLPLLLTERGRCSNNYK